MFNDDDDLDIINYNIHNQCHYYDTLSYNSIHSSPDSFNVVHLNIRSVQKNLDEFLLNLEDIKMYFSVIVLTETWMNDISDWIDVSNFNAFHSVRVGRRGGGVTVLVRSNLSSVVIPELTCNNDCYESVGVSVVSRGRTIEVMGVYRPPCSSLSDFNARYFDVIGDVGRSKTCHSGRFQCRFSVSVTFTSCSRLHGPVPDGSFPAIN